MNCRTEVKNKSEKELTPIIENTLRYLKKMISNHLIGSGQENAGRICDEEKRYDHGECIPIELISITIDIGYGMKIEHRLDKNNDQNNLQNNYNYLKWKLKKY